MTLAEYKAQVDAKYAGMRNRPVTAKPRGPRPAWVMFDPQGRFEGIRGLASDIATAEEAHKKFTPLKKDRDRENAEGYVIRLAEPIEWKALIAALDQEAKS
ncbi:hypothetical protein P3H15_27440 [Rhodococcus sp. T2V]|uniref:hypothetical protein n=1 Tax=Rhodococcus sp. T2V TaxID=3034164 RepID=UPI0023E2827F|nr:hypothetical protein [Rhodococcus sp. T2V]MDF3308757.1 hypothetical protein [Rhodococcus sp. T2V]